MSHNAQDARLDSFRRGEDLAVDVSAIEKELTSLWKAAAKDTDQVTTRACLWNLAVHSPGYEESDQLREQLETIYPSLPMRTLVLEVESGIEPALSAWVSARCHLTPNGKQVCSEEVTIRCDASATARLSPLISALLVPDIPSAAWWPDLSHAPDAMMAHFVDTVDRVVLDTSTAQGARGLQTLRRLSQVRRATRRMIGDLAWHRISPWRSLLARLFDSQVAREDLARMDTLEIQAVGRPGDATGSPALLLGGWLASCLGWEPQGDHWLRPDGGLVRCEVSHQRGKRRNELLRVTLRAGEHVYTVERGEDCLLRSHAQHIEEGVAAILRLRQTTDAELLQRELGPMGDDPLLWQAMDAALFHKEVAQAL